MVLPGSNVIDERFGGSVCPQNCQVNNQVHSECAAGTIKRMSRRAATFRPPAPGLSSAPGAQRLGQKRSSERSEAANEIGKGRPQNRVGTTKPLLAPFCGQGTSSVSILWQAMYTSRVRDI